jgi:hypothetical protein
MQVRISFTASGWVSQYVEILETGWTAETIQKGLKDGTLATTIQKDGGLDIVESGKVIGVVVDVTNVLEYDDYEVQ